MKGQFWLATNPEDVTSGDYRPDDGLLRLDGELVECMEVVSRGPSHIERRPLGDENRSYRVFGALEDGSVLTLPDATRGQCKHGADVSQEFLFLLSLEGGQVAKDKTFVGATARYAGLDGLAWHGEIQTGDGTLGIEAHDEVRFSRIPSFSVEQVERFAVGPLSTLLTLLTGKRVTPSALSLRDDAGGTIVVRRRHRDTLALLPHLLWLHPAQISTPMLGVWYQLSDRLIPLTSAVAKTIAGDDLDVEVRILTLSAAGEAIHRTLHDEKVMSKAEAAAIRRAAAAAVPENVRDRVQAMLGGLSEQSYGERLAWMASALGDLGDEVCGRAAPELAEGDKLLKECGRGYWLDAVKKARNGFAHQSRRSPEELRTYAGEMYTLYESLRWAVTGWLLLELGITVPQISDAFHRSSAYHLFRQRAGHYWPGFDARPPSV